MRWSVVLSKPLQLVFPGRVLTDLQTAHPFRRHDRRRSDPFAATDVDPDGVTDPVWSGIQSGERRNKKTCGSHLFNDQDAKSSFNIVVIMKLIHSAASNVKA
jgi:hypothetical protein